MQNDLDLIPTEYDPYVIRIIDDFDWQDSEDLLSQYDYQHNLNAIF